MSATTINGTVEAVHIKTISNGKLRIGLCIKDCWYNLLARELVSGADVGAFVEFVATDKGRIGWCIKPETFKMMRAIHNDKPPVRDWDVPPTYESY